MAKKDKKPKKRANIAVNIQSSSEEDIRRLHPAQKKEQGKTTHLHLKVSKTKDQRWRDKQRTAGDSG